jgi:hypothetical protein
MKNVHLVPLYRQTIIFAYYTLGHYYWWIDLKKHYNTRWWCRKCCSLTVHMCFFILFFSPNSATNWLFIVKRMKEKDHDDIAHTIRLLSNIISVCHILMVIFFLLLSILFSSLSLHHVLLFCILTPPGGVALNRLFFPLFWSIVIVQSVSSSHCILLSIREHNRWEGKKICLLYVAFQYWMNVSLFKTEGHFIGFVLR